MNPNDKQPILPPQVPVQTPPAQSVPVLHEDKVTGFSITTLIFAVSFPFIGMIMAIVGLDKAKKTDSKINKTFALCSLIYTLLVQILLIIAFVIAWNSPSFQQRRAEQVAQQEQSEAISTAVEDRMDVNQAEFDKIEVGMTKEEVGDITNSTVSFCEENKPVVGATTCYWGPGAAIRKNISVVFENDEVVSKDKTGF